MRDEKKDLSSFGQPSIPPNAQRSNAFKCTYIYLYVQHQEAVETCSRTGRRSLRFLTASQTLFSSTLPSRLPPPAKSAYLVVATAVKFNATVFFQIRAHQDKKKKEFAISFCALCQLSISSVYRVNHLITAKLAVAQMYIVRGDTWAVTLIVSSAHVLHFLKMYHANNQNISSLRFKEGSNLFKAACCELLFKSAIISILDDPLTSRYTFAISFKVQSRRDYRHLCVKLAISHLQNSDIKKTDRSFHKKIPLSNFRYVSENLKNHLDRV